MWMYLQQDHASLISHTYVLIYNNNTFLYLQVLVVHPDKGGDAAKFHEVQSAFELLRTIAEQETIGSFTDVVDDSADDLGTYNNDPDWQPPSWEFYANAAEEVRVFPHPGFSLPEDAAGLSWRAYNTQQYPFDAVADI